VLRGQLDCNATNTEAPFSSAELLTAASG
jgi:hypothetical protein